MSTWYVQSDGEPVGPLDSKGMEVLAANGRLGPGTLICREGATEWSRADSDGDVAGLFGSPEGASDLAKTVKALHDRHQSACGWFQWIAILSVVNSVLALTGSQWGFLIGLGITQIVDGITLAVVDGEEGLGRTLAMVVAFVIDVCIAGGVFLLGIFARKGSRSAYIVGIVLYSLDGLIVVLAQDWLAAGFHAFALFIIVGGFMAFRRYQQLVAAHPELAAT
jgi:hypothetical protein